MDEDLLKKLVRGVSEIKRSLDNGRLKEWFSVEEAADYLGISINTLYKYVADGNIPFRKIPGSNLIRFRKRTLDIWLETGKKLN